MKFQMPSSRAICFSSYLGCGSIVDTVGINELQIAEFEGSNPSGKAEQIRTKVSKRSQPIIHTKPPRWTLRKS
jgi:hypothetical protein